MLSRFVLGVLPAALLLGGLAACQTPAEAPPQACTTAEVMQNTHADVLAATGWAAYVRDHTCLLEYVDYIEPKANQSDEWVYLHTVGRAYCGEGRMEVVDRRRSGIPLPLHEVVTTIVHEAAHLEDGCANGEPPALEAESAFLQDVATFIDACREGGTCPAWVSYWQLGSRAGAR